MSTWRIQAPFPLQYSDSRCLYQSDSCLHPNPTFRARPGHASWHQHRRTSVPPNVRRALISPADGSNAASKS